MKLTLSNSGLIFLEIVLPIAVLHSRWIDISDPSSNIINIVQIATDYS